MPNFPPLRRYVHGVVDRWIDGHGLQPPFLEIGCGTGDLALHLAKRGWHGTALDSSPAALARARERLAGWPGVTVSDGALASLEGKFFQTALIMDVIEHVKDDAGLLRQLSQRLAPGGALVLLTPVNPSEWRQDDVLYGHYRRYAWDDLEAKMNAAGLTLLDRWNVTVPFMWILRRVYLALLPVRLSSGGQDQLTAASSIYNPWDQRLALAWAGKLLGWTGWWAPLFAIQHLFAKSRRGHAAMFLARKAR